MSLMGNLGMLLRIGDIPIEVAYHMGMLHDAYHQNPWSHANEKSVAAQGREDQARGRFDHLKNQMDLALYENTMTTIGLACHAKSDSPLKLLPTDVLDNILAFAGCTKPLLIRAVKSTLARRTANEIVPFAGLRTPENQLNLGDVSLFHPGSKLVIPFSKPNLHLTSACWRDLKKHVKTHDNWDLKRTAATAEQKRECRESRKGTVYFVNAVFSVPGRKSSAKRKSASVSSTTTGGGDRKDPPPMPLSPEDQAKATAALQAAIQSATSDPNGNIDPGIFQRALDAGYSKSFILVKVADHWESIKDTKPPAVKKAKADETKE